MVMKTTTLIMNKHCVNCNELDFWDGYLCRKGKGDYNQEKAGDEEHFSDMNNVWINAIKKHTCDEWVKSPNNKWTKTLDEW